MLFIVGRGRQEPVGGGRWCCESSSFYNCRKGPAGAGRRGKTVQIFTHSLKYCGDEMLLVDVMFIKDVCVIIT